MFRLLHPMKVLSKQEGLYGSTSRRRRGYPCRLAMDYDLKEGRFKSIDYRVS